MFEQQSVQDLTRWVSALACLERDVSDAARIDQLRILEELKAAAAAAQCRVAAALDTSQRAVQQAAGVKAAGIGKAVGDQIALARRESPHRGNQHLGLAKVLVHEMPHTLAALESGQLSEWRATIVVRETACLSLEDRRAIDRELCGDLDRLVGHGDRQLAAEVRRAAHRLDPQSLVERARRAEKERRVSLRAAPDTMSYLTGLLPVAQGVAVYAALVRSADTLRASGDPRSRGQIMADTLVERVTGLATPHAAPVDVKLVMTERTLLAGDSEPAHLEGYGAVPAQWARDLVLGALSRTQVWIQRLYTAPGTGRLVAMDSRARAAPRGLADFIETRDQQCRTPWCEAPIRHRDHVVDHQDGGATSEANLQGLCEHCNYVKQTLGWSSQPRPGPRHTVRVTTPTGHTYHSTAPPLPGTLERPLIAA